MNNITELLGNRKISFVFSEATGGFETADGLPVLLILQMTCQIGLLFPPRIQSSQLQFPSGDYVQGCDENLGGLNRTLFEAFFEAYAVNSCEEPVDTLKAIHFYGIIKGDLNMYHTLQTSTCAFTYLGTTTQKYPQFAVNYVRNDLSTRATPTKLLSAEKKSAILQAYVTSLARLKTTTAEFILNDFERREKGGNDASALISKLVNVAGTTCSCTCRPPADGARRTKLSVTDVTASGSSSLVQCGADGLVTLNPHQRPYSMMPHCSAIDYRFLSSNSVAFYAEVDLYEYNAYLQNDYRCEASPAQAADPRSGCECNQSEPVGRVIKEHLNPPLIRQVHTMRYYQCYAFLPSGDCKATFYVTGSTGRAQERRSSVCFHEKPDCIHVIDILPGGAQPLHGAMLKCATTCTSLLEAGNSEEAEEPAVTITNIPTYPVLTVEVQPLTPVKIRCRIKTPLHMHYLAIVSGKRSETFPPSFESVNVYEMVVPASEVYERRIIQARCLLLTVGGLVIQSSMVTVENPNVTTLAITSGPTHFGSYYHTCRLCGLWNPIGFTWWWTDFYGANKTYHRTPGNPDRDCFNSTFIAQPWSDVTLTHTIHCAVDMFLSDEGIIVKMDASAAVRLLYLFYEGTDSAHDYLYSCRLCGLSRVSWFLRWETTFAGVNTTAISSPAVEGRNNCVVSRFALNRVQAAFTSTLHCRAVLLLPNDFPIIHIDVSTDVTSLKIFKARSSTKSIYVYSCRYCGLASNVEMSWWWTTFSGTNETVVFFSPRSIDLCYTWNYTVSRNDDARLATHRIHCKVSQLISSEPAVIIDTSIEVRSLGIFLGGASNSTDYLYECRLCGLPSSAAFSWERTDIFGKNMTNSPSSRSTDGDCYSSIYLMNKNEVSFTRTLYCSATLVLGDVRSTEGLHASREINKLTMNYRPFVTSDMNEIPTTFLRGEPYLLVCNYSTSSASRPSSIDWTSSGNVMTAAAGENKIVIIPSSSPINVLCTVSFRDQRGVGLSVPSLPFSRAVTGVGAVVEIVVDPDTCKEEHMWLCHIYCVLPETSFNDLTTVTWRVNGLTEAIRKPTYAVLPFLHGAESPELSDQLRYDMSRKSTTVFVCERGVNIKGVAPITSEPLQIFKAANNQGRKLLCNYQLIACALVLVSAIPFLCCKLMTASTLAKPSGSDYTSAFSPSDAGTFAARLHARGAAELFLAHAIMKI